MQFQTQASSKPRLKNDTLGNDVLKELYTAYELMDIGAFKVFAEGVVMAGGGKQPRKIEICNAINNTQNKATALKKAQDFILAGMGLGV